jgi:hypothetical protein
MKLAVLAALLLCVASNANAFNDQGSKQHCTCWRC